MSSHQSCSIRPSAHFRCGLWCLCCMAHHQISLPGCRQQPGMTSCTKRQASQHRCCACSACATPAVSPAHGHLVMLLVSSMIRPADSPLQECCLQALRRCLQRYEGASNLHDEHAACRRCMSASWGRKVHQTFTFVLSLPCRHWTATWMGVSVSETTSVYTSPLPRRRRSTPCTAGCIQRWAGTLGLLPQQEERSVICSCERKAP